MSAKTGGYKACIICGKQFFISPSRIANAKWCSKECWSIRSRKVNKCLYCSKDIVTSQVINKKYCGNTCRNEHYKTRLKGENAPRWQGGKTEINKCMRTRAEFATWRKEVFVRDNYTCQECGVRCKSEMRIELHPHHIKPLARYPELAYAIDNGKTLCSKCHWKLHKTERVREYKSQVIIDRWEKYTNKKVVKLGN